MTKQNDYWKKRLEKEMKAKQDKEQEIDKELSDLYRYHQTNIEKEIQSFYQRYANSEGISVAEAKKRADSIDVQTFSDKARRYVEEKNFSQEAQESLKLYNLKMKVTRAELLQYNMDLELVALAEGEHKLTEKYLKEGYEEELKLQSGILGEYIQNPIIQKHSMESIINTPFKGATWSEKIWHKQQVLQTVVASMVAQTLSRGRSALTMIPELRKEFGVSKYEAKRLAVTEVARVQTEAAKITMLDNKR